MKGYKAFKKGLICDPTGKNPKQYAENTVFEESTAAPCHAGMHFCKYPLDVLNYYPLVDGNGDITEFAEVESLGEVKTDDDIKYCTDKLKIGEKLNFSELVTKHIEALKDNDTKNIERAQIGSSGDWAKIGSSGDGAQIGSSGDGAQIGSNGDRAQIGSSGDRAKIGSSGDWAQIGSSGDRAQIGSSGDWAKIGSSGDRAKIGSSGDRVKINSCGRNAVIMCAGEGSLAKAQVGSWITLAEWGYRGCEWTPICVKTEYVDGERIKADTYYRLQNGEFCEVER